MPITVYKCNTPTKPASDFLGTCNFGFPKGTIGRNGQTIKGIVLHCIPNAINYFDSMVTRGWKIGDPATPKVVSVHYAIGQNGVIRQYVCDSDTAWGFAPQLANNVCLPPPCTIDWSLVTANPTVINPDEYLIHIAIESPIKLKGSGRLIANDDCDGCENATVLDDHAEARLTQLLAWLTTEYNIVVSEDFIQFAQNVVVCPPSPDPCPADIENECACADLEGVLCCINDYCERCLQPNDPRYADGHLSRIYGENANQCLTSQSVTALLLERIRLNGSTLGIVDDEGVFHPIQLF